MISPGFGLIVFFIILPFLSAIILSFTNQRLISPNPTEYVGLANYKQLLSVGVLSPLSMPVFGSVSWLATNSTKS